jgi:hypothetical protein
MHTDTTSAPARSPRLNRHILPGGLVLCAIAAIAFSVIVGSASALSVHSSRAAAHHQRTRGHGRRLGGRVRGAWPKSGRAPRTARARWLARQVGAIKPRPCAKHWRHARRRCHLKAIHHGAIAVAAMSTVTGDPGSPPGEMARIVSAVGASTPYASAAGSPNAITLPLQLVRSYQIPADDPSYNSLLDWSWTYDSAVSAAAFAATGDRANSGQLLDQLAALQHADGSIEVAFDTTTGQGAAMFRSGTIAWLGLAAATYDRDFASSRYLNTEELAANYLMSLQTTSGLIQGGPDVTWVSTEHNLVAYEFLARLASELQAAGNTNAAGPYQAAASTIAAAINAKLLVTDASGTHFLQGLNDTTQALDVQALGAMYLQGTGQGALAAQVLAYAQSNFAQSNRSVSESSAQATYNMTYSAPGPFSGYAPYAGAGAPDVIWAEGSGEMRLGEAALGQSTSALDASIASWSAITNGGGQLQADQTVTNSSYGSQYHVWPASTATAWTLLSHAPTFFAAPVPAVSTVTNWTAVRGGNLLSTYPDGRVSMTAGAGERRVLATSGAGSDYTITSNATLLSGAGYGVYLRATVNASSQLTGYCVQFDHAYSTGQIVVRELQNDLELSVPIARGAVPAGFVWYGLSHVLVISAKGNALNVTLDGVQTINVPDLAAASATAVKNSIGVTSTITPPVAGSYGLRAWSDGMVSLQQMTVGP